MKRILSARQHFRQPVQSRIRVVSPHALDKRRSGIVMFVFVPVVADAPFPAKPATSSSVTVEPSGKASTIVSIKLYALAQIPIGQQGDPFENFLVRLAGTRSQSSLLILQRMAQCLFDFVGGQRFQCEQLGSAQERVDDVVARVVGGRPDQTGLARFHARRSKSC